MSEEEVITTAKLRRDMHALLERVKEGETIEIRRYSETVGFIVPRQRYRELLELERRYGKNKHAE
jgi:antitoxin (DNA-binding transcriptional repressor) of toxin-antitoxin stability system